MTALFGLLLAPFALALFLMVARPITRYVGRRMPDSRAKRILFLHWKN